MIGKIKGTLIELEGNVGLIETESGVSYLAFLTPAIISMTKVGTHIDIYTYLQVRDDALILFGFKTKEEYDFFKLLLGVPGVGPKTAYSVISFSKSKDLINAVKDNNSSYFSQIPGLGKKTAMKIILELSQKISSEFKLDKMYLSEDDKTVVEALMSLGFRAHDVKKILSQMSPGLSLEEKIKTGIKLATNPKRYEKKE